jgi:hypothetical protein
VYREGLLSGVRPVSVPGEKSPTSRKEREKWGTPFVYLSKQLKIDVVHPSVIGPKLDPSFSIDPLASPVVQRSMSEIDSITMSAPTPG